MSFGLGKPANAESVRSSSRGARCDIQTLSPGIPVDAIPFFTGGSVFIIQNASGTDLVTFKPTKSTYYILFFSPSLTSGASYSIYTGGSFSGGSNLNGLYTGGSYSGETLKKTFTLTSKGMSVGF